MKSRIDRVNVCLLVLAMSCLWTWATPANAVVWEVLPFPDDSSWPGSQGQPATTNGGIVTLQGRSVRTVQSFSDPLSISCDVLLQARTEDDGYFGLSFLPAGVPSNLSAPNIKLLMIYRNGGSDDLAITSNNIATVWGEVPFGISSQTVYHVGVDLSTSGELTWRVNDVTNTIPLPVAVTYNPFRVQLEGWQPDNVWQVSNFAVVPEPSTAILVAFGLGLLGVIRRRKTRQLASLGLRTAKSLRRL